ncbi:hypothetical protein [Streptomyces sp. NPDC059378]
MRRPAGSTEAATVEVGATPATARSALCTSMVNASRTESAIGASSALS